MAAAWLWTASEWRRRWPMLLTLAALIMLAGGVATALAAGARRADSAFDRFETATAAPNLFAELDLDQADGSALDRADEVAAIDGVEGVVVESWWAISLFPELDPPGVVVAFAIGPAASFGRIDESLVVRGRLPGTDQSDAVVINEEAARLLDVDIGDSMSFRTASPQRIGEWAENDGQFDSAAALDGPVVEVVVVAVAVADDDLGEDRFPNITFSEGFARAHRDDIAHLEPAIFARADPRRIDEVAGAMQSALAPVTARVAPGAGPG